MSNLGFSYSKIGLAGLGGLANLEASRNWKRYQLDTENTEAFNEGIGNLIGNTLGTGLHVYQQMNKKGNPKKVMDDPTQSDEAIKTKQVIAAKEKGLPVIKEQLPPTPSETRQYSPEYAEDNRAMVAYRSPARAAPSIMDSIRSTGEQGYNDLKTAISPFTNFLTGWTS